MRKDIIIHILQMRKREPLGGYFYQIYPERVDIQVPVYISNNAFCLPSTFSLATHPHQKAATNSHFDPTEKLICKVSSSFSSP